MNQHDTEKVENLLHHAGWRPAATLEDADLLLINTCSIRAKAEHRLVSDLGALREWKRGGPGRVLGVGGCVAQQEGDVLLRRFGHLDFVFGTHNLRLVPSLVEAARGGERHSETGETRSLERFDLPQRHPAYPGHTPGRAWLTVMEGCDLFCSFCIVPRTRGRELSRPAGEILAEAHALAERGVTELTLLGQTVNAYGRHERRRGAWPHSRGHGQPHGHGPHSRGPGPHPDGKAGTLPFAALLEELAAIPGIERLRYTSPHPIFFDEGLIRAHADIPAVQPHVHLPLQSGSDRVLEQMRRRYGAASYLDLVARLRAARPDLAVTTDLIVGFPGETAADFEETLRVVREAAFVDSYSFKYSPRPGTRAAELEAVVSADEAQERLERLQALQRELTLAYHRRRVGETTQVLVEGPSRRPDGPTGRGRQLAGRDPYHRVVNFEAPAGAAEAGAYVPVRLVEASPHSLIGECAVQPPAGPAEEESRAPASARGG
jgi:tRNA-2-methylthio-N6-dimethylallyladenosine synthase